jgi:hypothetical protein
VAVFAVSQVAFYFAFKWIVGSLDPTKAKRQEAKSKSNKVLGKLGVCCWFSVLYINVGLTDSPLVLFFSGQGFEADRI